MLEVVLVCEAIVESVLFFEPVVRTLVGKDVLDDPVIGTDAVVETKVLSDAVVEPIVITDCAAVSDALVETVVEVVEISDCAVFSNCCVEKALFGTIVNVEDTILSEVVMEVEVGPFVGVVSVGIMVAVGASDPALVSPEVISEAFVETLLVLEFEVETEVVSEALVVSEPTVTTIVGTDVVDTVVLSGTVRGTVMDTDAVVLSSGFLVAVEGTSSALVSDV